MQIDFGTKYKPDVHIRDDMTDNGYSACNAYWKKEFPMPNSDTITFFMQYITCMTRSENPDVKAHIGSYMGWATLRKRGKFTHGHIPIGDTFFGDSVKELENSIKRSVHAYGKWLIDIGETDEHKRK